MVADEWVGRAGASHRGDALQTLRPAHEYPASWSLVSTAARGSSACWLSADDAITDDCWHVLYLGLTAACFLDSASLLLPVAIT